MVSEGWWGWSQHPRQAAPGPPTAPPSALQSQLTTPHTTTAPPPQPQEARAPCVGASSETPRRVLGCVGTPRQGMSGYPDYRSRPSYRYPDYPELRYRSSSHPRTSTYPRPSNYASYTSPRKRSSSRDTYSVSRYGDENRHYGSYGHEPRDYGRYEGGGGPKDYYQPRNTYLPPPQYNNSGYGDYGSRRSGYGSYGNFGSDVVAVQQPYVSPMGYKTVSDRRRFNCWDSHRYGEMRDSTYRNRRNESYGWGTTDYGHRPRQRYSSRYQSDYYNPGYSQPAPAPVRRVAWEDLSTSALNYRDSSRSQTSPIDGDFCQQRAKNVITSCG